MAKASLVLTDGTKVQIEGGAEEVAELLEGLESKPVKGRATRGPKKKSTGRKTTQSRPSKQGPMDYIRELIAKDFFVPKRSRDEVQEALEEGAHIYTKDIVGMALYRLVRKGELRRIREADVWKYVNL